MHPFRPIARLCFACLLIPALAADGPGQATPPAVPQPASGTVQPAAPASDSTVLRANANLVLVDVVVTERDRTVPGLDRTHFHIFEDGREQPIVSFDEHQPGGKTPGPIAPQAALPPHTYSNAPAYPGGGAVNVLLLDGLNTPMADQMNARRQMLQFMGKIQPGTSLAIFTLSSRLRLVEGFTTDVAQLTRALQDKKAGPQASVMLDPASDQALDSTLGDMATAGADQDAIAEMEQFEADLTAFQTDQRVQMTLEAMQELARYLNGIPGRKNLIWFSGSFPLALDPDDSLESPFSAMRNYSDQIRETSELLSAARVAVYPVDARGLMTLPSASAAYASSSNLMGGTTNGGRKGSRTQVLSNRPSVNKDDANFMKQNMEEHASMQQIAEQTGGKEFINTNGLKEAVASAIENGATYYTIGYVPANKEFDGQFRKIDLRLDNKGYKLAFRRGYYADEPDKTTAHQPGAVSLIMAATLHGSPPATQILFRARVLPATDPLLEGAKLSPGRAGELTATLNGPVHRIVVDLRADPHGIVFEDTPEGKHRARIEFALVAYDAEGKRVNYSDSGYQVSLSSEQYAGVLGHGVPVRLALDLPAGQAFLRIAVHDLNAGRAGSMEVPVMVGSN